MSFSQSNLVLLLVLATWLSPAVAQDYLVGKRYNMWIETFDSQRLSGVLYQTKEDYVELYEDGKLNVVPFDQIHKMELRLNKKMLLGTFLGAGTGFLIGALYSRNANNNYFWTAKEIAAIVNTTFTLVGAGVGASVGVNKKQISIENDPARFEQNRKKLARFEYAKMAN